MEAHSKKRPWRNTYILHFSSFHVLLGVMMQWYWRGSLSFSKWISRHFFSVGWHKSGSTTWKFGAVLWRHYTDIAALQVNRLADFALAACLYILLASLYDFLRMGHNHLPSFSHCSGSHPELAGPRFVLLFYSILLDFTQCKSVCLNISWTIPCFWLVLEHVMPYRLVALTWAQKTTETQLRQPRQRLQVFCSTGHLDWQLYPPASVPWTDRFQGKIWYGNSMEAAAMVSNGWLQHPQKKN